MPESPDFSKSIIAAAPSSAPDMAGRMLRQLVDLGIDGNSVLPSSRASAGRALEHHREVEAALDALVTTHLAWSGTQGFVTNIGGFATMLIGAPAGFAGLAILHARLVGCVAHLRGYDVDETRIRHAVLMTLLGQRIVDDLVAKGQLPGSPLVLATAPGLDEALGQQIAERVMTAMLTASGGKAALGLVARRIPVIGAGVGAITDTWNTMAIARYAREQFVSRRPRLTPGG
ncbi:hypothetical protein HMPREF1531_01052 [Propionibacterium sp. oral taxon 192 str. F0372]|uniref:EcsC family protein n=1 Tax=Propionibacterium sp. oral taxon 192 TaxID=671222 RepID=UPI000352E68A|nr:EcsC family protein [Propionibacterium sp. oral taxon 192]EPH05623.1 hypothetical protein HMPREF1531_01052 [Propionibacterium sp. oral taxon 192 str. F0372]